MSFFRTQNLIALKFNILVIRISNSKIDIYCVVQEGQIYEYIMTYNQKNNKKETLILLKFLLESKLKKTLLII